MKGVLEDVRTRGMSFSISCCWRSACRWRRWSSGRRGSRGRGRPASCRSGGRLATSTRGVSSASAHASAIRSCPGATRIPASPPRSDRRGERHPTFRARSPARALRGRTGRSSQFDLQEGTFRRRSRPGELETSRHSEVIFQLGDPLSHRFPRERPEPPSSANASERNRAPSYPIASNRVGETRIISWNAFRKRSPWTQDHVE